MKKKWLLVIAAFLLILGVARSFNLDTAQVVTPTPTATSSPMPSPIETLSPTPTATPAPINSPSPVPTLKPTPKPTPLPTAAPIATPATQAPIQNQGGYACDCGKTCPEISSCAEAQYQLNNCGCSIRDGDNDGIACDSGPLHCQN